MTRRRRGGVLTTIDTGPGASGRLQVFVSYAGPDRAWADRVVEAVEDAAGDAVSVTVSHRDFRVGGNAVLAMDRAIDRADVVVLLLSRSYLEEHRYTTEEWTGAVMHRPEGSRRRLVPLRLEPVTPPALLRSLTMLDVFGMDPELSRGPIAAAVLGQDVDTAPPLSEHWVRSVRGSPGGTRFLFTGRNQVLADVARFAARGGPGLAVVTGMPGAGKSAVLGALVVRGMAAELLPPGLRARIPRIHLSAAVHASDRTAAEVVGELARALAFPLSVGGARRELAERLARMDATPLVVVDAVDEAADDVVPLLVDLAGQLRLIVGVRSGVAGALPAGLRALHPVVMNLDGPGYRSEDDVAAYVAQRLRSDERADGYGRTELWPRRLLVDAVGREVGRAARRNFLIAQFMTEELLAREPLHSVAGRWSEKLQWPSRVEDWMRRDLQRRLIGDRADLGDLLRPLAFADRGGVPAEIWRTAAGLFRGGPAMSVLEQQQVLDVLGFFVAVTGEQRPRFSMRHEAFAAHFRSGPLTGEYAAQMSSAVRAAVPTKAGRRRWDQAPDYVRWSLLSHAAEAGELDDLLTTEPACLAAVVVESAGAPLATVTTAPARQAAGVFRRTSYSAAAAFPERVSVLQFHARLARIEWLANALSADLEASSWSAPWRAGGPPAVVPLSSPLSTWEVFPSRTADSRPALVVVATDASCTVLEAATGAPVGPRFSISPSGDQPVACTAWNGADGEVLVAAADDTGAVRVWQATGPDAAPDPVLLLRQPPPVRHVVPLRGPADLDLLWIASGTPPEAAVWATVPPSGQDDPLVDPMAFGGDFVVGVGDGVLCGSRSGELRLWTYDADGRPCVDLLAQSGGNLRGLIAAGSAADLCVVVDQERTLRVRWHPPGASDDGEQNVAAGGALVRCALAGGASQAVLAAGDSNGELRTWRLTRDAAPVILTSVELDGPVRALELLDEGDLVAVGGRDGQVSIHAASLPSQPTRSPHSAPTSVPLAHLAHGEQLSHLIGLGRDGDGPLLATRSLGGLTKLWRVPLPEPTGSGSAPSAEPVRLLAAAPLDADADLLAAAVQGRVDVDVRVIDPRLPGRSAAAIPVPHGEEVFALAAASLDAGAAVVCAVGDEEMSVWRIDQSGSAVLVGRTSTQEEPTDHLLLLSAGHAGPVIARGGPEGLRLTAFDPATGSARHIFSIPDTAVTALMMSRHEEGGLLVVGDDDGILRVITGAAGETRRVVEADHGESISHAFTLHRGGASPVVVSIGRYGAVRTWDLGGDTLSPRVEFRNPTEIVHAVPVVVRGRGSVAWLDLTGSLQIHDVLAPSGRRLTHHFPGPGGRPSRLVAAPGDPNTLGLAVAHSTGRLLLVDLSDDRSTVADLNCDLADLAWAPRSSFLVGAYGAALIGIAVAPASA